jgi:predicted TIM-barrel fold metal-dependent hydrolase
VTRVDSHLHVWRAAQGETPGVATIVTPQTDVSIGLARRTIAEHGIDRAVLVQPVFRGEDNQYVADCARTEPQRFAAVAVVDPRKPGADERLEHWAAQGCRGLRLRPRIAAEADAFGHPDSFPLWQTAARLQMVVSVLAGPEHLSTLATLAERFGNVPIVLDHLAYPNVEAGVAHPDFQRLLDFARHDNVWIKLSGYYHFCDQTFPYESCWEMIGAVHDRFGPGRLLWGSDFPHVVSKIGYDRGLMLPELAMRGWSEDDRRQVMGLNALRLYWPPGDLTVGAAIG